MTEAVWRLVVDQQGVTIASDRFQLTANGPHPAHLGLVPDDAVLEAAEPGHMQAVVSELQTMTWHTYGQFCGLARALEIIGERWALLVVRDLLVGARTVGELHRGFPRLPLDILRTRLTELEHTGVVRRRTRPPGQAPDTVVVYELTEYGRGLDAAAVALAAWGAQTLGEPRPEQVVTGESLIMAMRSNFRPQAAAGRRMGFELRYGDIVIHARVEDGRVESAAGPLPGADLIIDTGAALWALMAGDISPDEAIHAGSVRLTGDPGLLTRFVEIFHIPRLPARRA